MEDFRQLFDTFYPRVYAFFRHRNVAEPQAEELTQEVFLRVYTERASCRSDDPAGWIFVIAHNIYCNQVRGEQAIKRQRPPTGELRIYAQRSDDEPVDRLVEEERKKWLERALPKLPPKRRRCLKLWLRGYSIADIGKLMSISPNTVKPTLVQARKQLRELLAQAREESDAEADRDDS